MFFFLNYSPGLGLTNKEPNINTYCLDRSQMRLGPVPINTILTYRTYLYLIVDLIDVLMT